VTRFSHPAVVHISSSPTRQRQIEPGVANPLPSAAEALDRKGILEAIALSAQELLRVTDVKLSIPKVLEHIGLAANVERVHLLSMESTGPLKDRRIVGHVFWSRTGVATSGRYRNAVNITFADIGLDSWLPKLAGGETIAGNTALFPQSVQKFLKAGGIKSVAVVPVFVDGGWWGFIAFDACRSEREWSPDETDILKILAELIGSVEARAQHLRKLADATRIIENSPTVIYRLSPQKPYPLIFLSENIRRYGYDASELLADPNRWPKLIESTDLATAMADSASLVTGGLHSVHTEFRLKKPDGSDSWFEGVTAPLRDEAGKLIALEGILTDVTARKAAEQKLAITNILLTTAFESSPDAIAVVDQNAEVVSFNRRFVHLWNVPEDIMDARHDEPVLKLVTSRMKDESGFVDRVRFLYAHPEIQAHDELETKDGRIIDRQSASLFGSTREYLGRIWFFRDISRRRTAEQQLEHLARTDTLTGLPNRATFLDRLQLAFARAKRGSGGFAILYLDLDRFKDVNDTLGHPAGDALLRAVAARLMSCVRKTDVVARFGGDEFAVLQEDIADAGRSEVLADKIIEALSTPFTIGGSQIHSTVSIGIVPYTERVKGADAMMMMADLALYRAKDGGRNQYRFHVAELDHAVRERVAIAHDLHAAIERQEFELYYQPQAELASGRIVGVEALIRWHHPTRGLLSPTIFIPVAESSGSILVIGQWVIEEACRQIGLWRAGDIMPGTVAVNISAAQFKFAGQLDRIVSTALAKNAVAANELELELTESVLMETTQKHAESFDRLCKLGVRLVIDDFGTGFSSLDYLRSFRVARLKLASQFIDDVTTNADDAAIVRATISLAHELGMDVVAEGVANDEQRAFLISAGCKYAQGFYLGEPMSAAEMSTHLQQNLDIAAGIGEGGKGSVALP
jgi:diguanylate cyclase (GGDEF)-like protein/PAS domain S-box-containing protein